MPTKIDVTGQRFGRLLVVGDAEMANQTVSLRKRDGSRSNDLAFGEFLATVQQKIASRSSEL